MGDEKISVKVVVSKRPTFNGYFCAKKFWPNGSSEAEVTEAELKEMQEDEAVHGVLGVVVIPKAAPAPVAPPAPPPAPVEAVEEEKHTTTKHGSFGRAHK